MSLSKHIDHDKLISQLADRVGRRSRAGTHLSLKGLTFGTEYQSDVQIPKFRMPDSGVDPDAALQLVRSELELDGKPTLNLASFVGTYMVPQAEQLMMENISKNLSDADEYPALMAIHARCVSIISHLWNIPEGETAVGTATTGSSEAVQLGGLAMKRRWQEKRKKAGKPTDKPNIIMGANAQVALEKFARYFEVEARILPVSEESHYCLDPKLLKENVDENTIGVFVILGSTYTGHYEPVEEISGILDDICSSSGGEIDVPIHLDAASGGFIAPFLGAGGRNKWGFELPRVKSINTSGHKYGLVYAGLGWIIFRNEDQLPQDLVFELSYLGGSEKTYTLNFSRPGAQVAAQYFNFLHLGFSGYKFVMEHALQNARTLSICLEETGHYHCVSDIHRELGQYGGVSKINVQTGVAKLLTGADATERYNAGLPVVAFCFSKEFQDKYSHVKQASVSLLLRAKGWIIPNYPLPPKCEKQEILRVVIRESMTLDLVDKLLADIISVTEQLIEADEIDLRAFSKSGPASIEKEFQSMGISGKAAQHLMSMGIHKSTC